MKKQRKLVDGVWLFSLDGGKTFEKDLDQTTEGKDSPAAPTAEEQTQQENSGTKPEESNAGMKPEDVEKAAKDIAEKILNYSKISSEAVEKRAQASNETTVKTLDPDIKLFTNRKGVAITMKKSHTELVAGWFKNFIQWKAQGRPDSYQKMMEYAQKLEPLNTETAADGGNLVPTILHNVIVPLVEDMAVIRPNATVLDMTGVKTLDIPTIAGKPVMTINGEALQKGSSSMQFGKFTLTPYTLAAIVPITEEMVDYSPFNVVAIVSQAFADAIAKAEDRLFTVGTGSSQPTGLDSYTFAKTIALTNNLSWTDLNALYFGVTQSHRSKGSWLMSADTMAQLANMVDGQNRPIFDVGGVFQQEGLPSIKGRPVYEQNDIGGKIFFGNLKAYWIGASKQMRIDIAKEATVRGQSLWERDMIALRCEEKIDGELSDQRAFGEINGV